MWFAEHIAQIVNNTHAERLFFIFIVSFNLWFVSRPIVCRVCFVGSGSGSGVSNTFPNFRFIFAIANHYEQDSIINNYNNVSKRFSV